jgi:hypothetical protein
MIVVLREEYPPEYPPLYDDRLGMGRDIDDRGDDWKPPPPILPPDMAAFASFTGRKANDAAMAAAASCIPILFIAGNFLLSSPSLGDHNMLLLFLSSVSTFAFASTKLWMADTRTGVGFLLLVEVWLSSVRSSIIDIASGKGAVLKC